MVKISRTVAIIATAMTTFVVGSFAQAHADEILVVGAALGDSYHANIGGDGFVGPLNEALYEPGTTDVNGNSCFRLKRNAAHVLAESLTTVVLRDATCASAVPENINLTPQFPSHGQGVQVDTLKGDEQYVTNSVGGNPEFMPVALRAVVLQLTQGRAIDESDPQWQKSWRYYDQQVQTLVENAIIAIQSKAPNATIYQLGYPPLLPTVEQTLGAQRISDVQWLTHCPYLNRHSVAPLQKLLDRLNEAVRKASEVAGAVFVDEMSPNSAWNTYAPTGTHLCSTTTGVGGIRVNNPMAFDSSQPNLAAAMAGSFHPNELGVQLQAADLLQAVRIHQPQLIK